VVALSGNGKIRLIQQEKGVMSMLSGHYLANCVRYVAAADKLSPTTARRAGRRHKSLSGKPAMSLSGKLWLSLSGNK
jgi:hypothetical protein